MEAHLRGDFLQGTSVAPTRGMRRGLWTIAALVSCTTACTLVDPLDGLTGGAGWPLDAPDAADVVSPDEGGAVDETDARPPHPPVPSSDAGAGADAARDAGPPAIDGASEAAGACTAPGAVCTSIVPPGWIGPLAVYAGSSAGAPACPTSMTQVLDMHEQMDGPQPASCSCSCGAPSGATCGAVDYYGYGAPGCGTCVTSDIVLTPGLCSWIAETCDAEPYTYSSFASERAASGGQCAVIQAPPNVPPVTWETEVRACQPTGVLTTAGCGAGEVCSPAGSAPFGAAMCIAQAGDVACPAGPYSVKQVAYGGASDTRSCTACSCGPVEGAACSATLQFSNQPDCSQPFAVSGLPLSCGAITVGGFYGLVTTSGPYGGACAVAGGGVPVGTAVPDQPTTLCCAP